METEWVSIKDSKYHVGDYLTISNRVYRVMEYSSDGFRIALADEYIYELTNQIRVKQYKIDHIQDERKKLEVQVEKVIQEVNEAMADLAIARLRLIR